MPDQSEIARLQEFAQQASEDAEHWDEMLTEHYDHRSAHPD